MQFELNVIFELSSDQARAFLAAGQPLADVVHELPNPLPEEGLDLIGVFRIGKQGYAAFDQQNDITLLIPTQAIPTVDYVPIVETETETD